MKKPMAPWFLVLLSSTCSLCMAAAPTDAGSVSAAESVRLAAEVKSELLHAWKDYRKYAWGHDDLAPLSHKPHDWYAEPLLMTPVDALDTLVVMGLTDEADAARALIAKKLDFDKDIFVKNFEITIRLLGGLLSGYQLTGDERLLAKAEDLGTRLLPVFDSPTGLPYVEINLNDVGYAALQSVITKQKKDRMESFVLAETFKYFYLLFNPAALDFDAVTFNTEAHPLRATWTRGGEADPATEVDPRIGTAHGGNVF